MKQRIIYPTTDGGIAIIIPAPCNLTIEQIALKDVPAGVPYRIVETSDIPEDRSQRDAWEADFSNPDGHGIGPEAWFEANRPNNQFGEPK